MRALAGALALGMCLTPSIVTGQTLTPSAPRPAPAPAACVGRYQLVMQPGTDSLLGRVYLLDTVTGRVWADIQVTPPDNVVDAAVRRNAPADSSAADQEKFRKQFIANYGPCKGLTRCFVEVDRVRLTGDDCVSEIVTGR